MLLNNQSGNHFRFFLLWEVIFIASLPAICFSQPAHHWRFWTVEDGLAETWSNFVKISPQGNVWISHSESVDYFSRLDGMNVYTTPRVDPYAALFEFSDTLWTTRNINDFLMLYSTPWGKQTNSAQWTLTDETESKNIYSPLFQFNEGSILFIDSKFLGLYNQKTKTSEQIMQSGETGIGLFADMIREKEDLFWISGSKGIGQFRIDPNSPTRVQKITEYPLPEELHSKKISYLSQYKGGPVVCTVETDTDTRLMQWDGKIWEVLYKTGTNSGMIGWRTNLSSFWVYTIGSGLLYVHHGIEYPMQNNRVLAGEVNSFALQDDGVFWIATANGVARHANMLWEAAKGFPNERLTCHSLAEDNKKRIWFACIDKIICFDKGKWTSYSLPEGHQTKYWRNNSIICLANGKIVIHTIPAAFTFDPETLAFERIPLPRVSDDYFMKRISDSAIWFLGLLNTDKQILSLSFDGITFKDINQKPLVNNNSEMRNDGISIRNYAIMDDGKYLIASLAGVMLLNENTLTKIGPMKSAFCILRSENGEYWFGGINEIQAYNGKEWRLIKSDIDHVYSMTPASDGSVWVTAVNGVYRYLNGNWMKYTSEEGLPDCAYYSLLEDSQKRLWVGASRGVYLFQPESDKDAPKTILNPVHNAATFSTEGKIQILFTGIDKWKYTLPERLRFSHRLDEGEWSPFSSNTVFSATGISAGKHTFEVQAMDPNGNIEADPVIFPFTVQPPWYWQPNFILLFLAGLISLIYLSHHLVKANQELRRLASTDDLTGLHNRRHFIQLFEHEFSRTKRYGKPLSLLMIDADHFKSINDRFGHNVGDKALQILARCIQEHTRQSDLTARFGGEEFVVLLPETNSKDAVNTAERIRASVADENFSQENQPVKLTVSIGITSSVNDNDTTYEILSRADKAVYLAKDNGRNRIELA